MRAFLRAVQGATSSMYRLPLPAMAIAASSASCSRSSSYAASAALTCARNARVTTHSKTHIPQKMFGAEDPQAGQAAQSAGGCMVCIWVILCSPLSWCPQIDNGHILRAHIRTLVHCRDVDLLDQTQPRSLRSATTRNITGHGKSFICQRQGKEDGRSTCASAMARSGWSGAALAAAEAGSAPAQFLRSRPSVRLSRLPTLFARYALTMSRKRCSEKSPS